MSTKFTPGPWFVHEGGRQQNNYWIVTEGFQRDMRYDTKFYVAGIHPKNESNPFGQDFEAEANANLISAAPEMFEALQKIAKLYHADRTCSLPAQGYNEQETMQIGIDDYAAQIAESAIAKATGEKILNQQS